MTKVEEIIPDAEIERVHANANFGSRPKREVVAFALLQFACGYSTGYTAESICREHGLIGKRPRNRIDAPNLTKKGREYLWAAFGRTSV